MKTWLAAALILLFAVPAAAQTREDVIGAIEMNFGESELFVEAIDAIQAAVTDDDAETLAEWIAYPFSVTVDGEDYVFEGPEGVVEHYESMMTPEIRSAIVDQPFETLFVNAEGIMFGSGEMWISGICADDACSAFDVRIITIQGTSE